MDAHYQTIMDSHLVRPIVYTLDHYFQTLLPLDLNDLCHFPPFLVSEVEWHCGDFLWIEFVDRTIQTKHLQVDLVPICR